MKIVLKSENGLRETKEFNSYKELENIFRKTCKKYNLDYLYGYQKCHEKFENDGSLTIEFVRFEFYTDDDSLNYDIEEYMLTTYKQIEDNYSKEECILKDFIKDRKKRLEYIINKKFGTTVEKDIPDEFLKKKEILFYFDRTVYNYDDENCDYRNEELENYLFNFE